MAGYLGLSVMAGLPPDEVIALLRERLESLERRLAGQREALERERAEVPRLFLVESEYALAAGEAETAWTRSLFDELVTGAFPGLEQWRDFHETGHVPPDVAAIAERGTDTL
ncbi:hypothetical protein [Nonomuraea cavernae]|uniref:hypothetical protein n=1 Tax=Nonomuraea cavernae TaxID=2045107 RepID=UPI0033C6C6F3